MKRLQTILTVWLLLFGVAKPVSAQFHTWGADPGGLRWNQIETPTYRVVYPRGLDSLARIYALTLERAASPVGSSLGILPNAAYANRMPVILHPWTSYSNGLVTLAPRRMDLLTVPDAFPHEVTPWVRQLGIHESRHVAQLQAGAMKPFRWLNILTGQLASGAIAAIYGGPAFFEGDAVVAETALTHTGRGRSADFLEYYRVSFAAGDRRDFWRWRYGSQRYYTPDYYRAGYLAVGGIRATFDVPDLSARFYRRVTGHGVAFMNWDKTVREATGLHFKDAFAAVCDTLQQFWAKDELARGPFLQTKPVTAVPRRFTEYSGLDRRGDYLYAVRQGITQPDRLVRIYPDGTVKPGVLLGYRVSGPESGGPLDRTYWSEVVRDVRWPLRSYSIIRSFDGKTARKLTRKTRYFNPVPAPHEPVLSVIEYPVDGTSRVVLLDAENGSRLRDWQAPEGMQVVEATWVGDELYASAITDAGAGLYRVAGGFAPVLDPAPVSINALWALDGKLMFSSDLTGVQELYALDPSDGRVERLTNLRFGGLDFNENADTLYFSVLQPEGRMVHKVAWSELQPVAADFTQLPKYPFAEELAAGEKDAIDWDAPVEVSEPKPYNKLAHLFRFHSWLPFYFHFDSVDNLSMKTLSQDVGLGATAFWQNDLGSGYGFAGYHAAPVDGVWRHSLHASFTYTGLYPVIEASMDFGEREAFEYYVEKDVWMRPVRLKSLGQGTPSVSGELKVYIPWNFTSGGWQRGIVPTVSLLWNNDRYADGSAMCRTVLNLRGFIMQHKAESQVYPRLGVGAELAYSFRWVPGLLTPTAFGFLYGYLPGLHETHGLHWSVLYSRSFNGMFGEVFAATTPRGFQTSVMQWQASYPSRFKASLDYKLPLIPVDRALLGPVAYLRNFELTLHGDYSAFSSNLEKCALYSVGADLAAVLGNLLWIPFPTRIGVSYNYNGGPTYSKLVERGLPVHRHTFSLVFSVEM